MTIKKLKKKIMVNRDEAVQIINYENASSLYEGCFSDIPIEYYSGKIKLISVRKYYNDVKLMIFIDPKEV